MINYGLILKQKEKDNPSPLSRAIYLFSNVGLAVRCYGRALRFPEEQDAQMADLQAHIGDVIMQCRMAEEENGWRHVDVNDFGMPFNEVHVDDIVCHMAAISGKAMWALSHNSGEISEPYVKEVLCDVVRICRLLGWNPADIEHLGFIHTIEAYEDFKHKGWSDKCRIMKSQQGT